MSLEPSLDPGKLTFRRLEKTDFPQLHRWLHAPHVRAWFHRGLTLAEVTEEFSEYLDGVVPIFPHVASYDGKPIGMMAWERVGDFPELMRNYQINDPDTSNCDILIGELDHTHRGLGTAMVEKFLREIIFADPRITSCVIDPHTENKAAIRTYEKAGFSALRRVIDEEDGVELYLMELVRPLRG